MADTTDMAVLVNVVDEGSFAEAAKTMQMTPSAVSRRIRNLEERLGVRLLNRTTRSLSLTEPGETYYLRASQIIADIEDTERETAELYAKPQGRLRVTTSHAFGNRYLVKLIPDFLRTYPHINIELKLTDGLVDLVAEGTDVAIRSGNLEDSTLIARKIKSTKRVFCASPAYLAEHGTPRKPADLAQHSCLVRQDETQFYNEWHFDGITDQPKLRVSGRLTCNTIEVLSEAALSGAGILSVSEFVVEDALADGRLVSVLEEFEAGREIPIYALYLSNRQLSPKIRVFVDFVSKALQATPQAAHLS